jgi:uncharacterized protein (TIGR02646 family)
MKHILKGNAPQSLLEYKRTPNATYDGFSSKNDVRIALIKEQKGLCAYCNGRISNERNSILNKPKTGIEHYKSQEEYPHLQLEYGNMLGVCNGVSTDSNSAVQHCDTSRGSKALTIDPLSILCEKSIKYASDGRILSDEEAIQFDLNEILNLNQPLILRNRKSIVDDVLDRMKRYYPKKNNQSWTKAEIEKEIIFWCKEDNEGNLKPYLQIAIFYLQNKLKRIS